MNDMAPTITPKSDQLNADDLLAGPRTITIRDVRIAPGTEQPVAVFFDGDDGKPYLPCKSMRRVMVAMWGPDASAYASRRMTLYRDPSVTWGGMEVGGIRISHMSHIDKTTVVVLTATKKARKPFTVHPLAEQVMSAPPPAETKEKAAELKARILLLKDEIDAAPELAALDAMQDRIGAVLAWLEERGRHRDVEDLSTHYDMRLAAARANAFPGDFPGGAS